MTSKGYWGGQFCIVTGAASGIGLATAQLLSSNGATVLGLDRSKDAGTSANLFAEGNNLYRKCDLSVPEEIEKVFYYFKTSKLSYVYINNKNQVINKVQGGLFDLLNK